jgi:transmembrane sensor
LALGRLEVPDVASLEATFVLSDGSSIELEPGGSIATTENDGQRASLVLVQGEATFDIVPSQRQWTIDAGLATIEVLGTRFRVQRTDQEVDVSVERGTVRLRSEHLDISQQLLRPGETARIAIGPTNEETDGDGQQVVEAEEAEQATQEEMEPLASTSTPWEALARRGRFEEAYGRLGSRGLATQTEQARSIEELLLLADVARLSGHPREAVAPLEQAIAQYSAHRRASVAAFTLGRLHADVLGSPTGAVSAFERCLALGPPAALHADALARLAEARNRAGDREGAQAAAQEYLERYPDGQRARFLGTLVEN